MGEALETIPLEILVVEDDPETAATIAEILAEQGHSVSVEGRGDIALRRVSEQAVDLLISDIRLPGADGLTIFERIKQLRPSTAVILMSAHGSINEAVQAVKRDAANYLAKPFKMDELLGAVRDVASSHRFYAVAARAPEGPESMLIGESPAIVALREFVRTVANSDGPVLVTGETGTGKELVAETIHRLSRRREAPFVAVNCAAFADSLLEAELFGHERGAFTGATQAREGRFRTAHGGTLFLDEVGEIPRSAQAKLLRVLESGAVQPVGADHDCEVDVRVVSATNRDLRGDGADRFRDDLFYRLKMFHVHVPPLRERMSDLPLLVAHFMTSLADGVPPRIAPSAWAALAHYDFPGNVRELRNALGHALAVSAGAEIELRHLPPEFRSNGSAEPDSNAIQPLEQAGREFERDYLLRTLRATEWNKTRAAEMLGISRKTLWKKLKALGISKPS